MRNFALVLLATLAFTLAHAERADAPAVVPEQAKVVITWLQAVKAGDQTMLKTVFTEALVAKLEKEGWAAVMAQYQEALKDQFGDYQIKDFTFKYVGNATAGVVQIIYKGEIFPGELQVVKEHGEWKSSER
jgi:hypothetical protein